MIPIYIFIAIFLMFILPTLLILCLDSHQKALKICTVILSVAYFILLFIGTSFNLQIKSNNLVIYPDFTKPWFSLKFIPYNFSLSNILVNLALLFPIGFIVSVFSKRKAFLKTILYSFLVSLLIELYQFILPISRGTELTDILFNTLGGVLSGLYCFYLNKIKRRILS